MVQADADGDACVGLDAASLQTYLRLVLGEVEPMSIEPVSGGRSNPTYLVTAGPIRWVLRRPPFGLVLESAHDMGREVRVLRALAGSPVPIPRVVHYCEDRSVIGAPFYLMEWVEGFTLRGVQDAAALTAGERADVADAVVDTLVALHGIDVASVGLGDFGRPDGFLERQLVRWRKQWAAAHSVERPEVDELLGRLGRTLPPRPLPGLVHGDFKVDNLMFRQGSPRNVAALLDWEMSTVGDTLTDLGLLLSFWDEAGRPFHPLTNGVTSLPGFPSAAEMAYRYATGRGLEDLSVIDWYVSLADLKLAVILEQIHVRHRGGQAVGDAFEGIGEMVLPLLERALERTSASAPG